MVYWPERAWAHYSASVLARTSLSPSATKKPFFAMTTVNQRSQRKVQKKSAVFTGSYFIPPRPVVPVPHIALYQVVRFRLPRYTPLSVSRALIVLHYHHDLFHLSILKGHLQHGASLYQSFMQLSRSNPAKEVSHFLY